MAGLVPAIRDVFLTATTKDVDARVKHEHDEAGTLLRMRDTALRRRQRMGS